MTEVMDMALVVVHVGDLVAIALYFVVMAVIGKVMMAIPAVKKAALSLMLKAIDHIVPDEKVRIVLKELLMKEVK